MVCFLRSSILLMLMWLSVVKPFSDYSYELPNGKNIRHPCTGQVIYAVGHRNSVSGGRRNAFGEDFLTCGRKWNLCLCRKDSDKDGLTNGFELGDPDCKYKKGGKPSRTRNITHPGINNKEC